MSLDTALNDINNRVTLDSGAACINDYFAFKRWPTRVLGAVLLVLAMPIILILIALVRCTSRGPGLYCQIRIGRGGSEFKMYKIRTMHADAESVSGPSWCVPGDSRITPIGRILRLMHLDELPQLINVARGEMDLIGPRPERPEFVRWLASEIPNYLERLDVLPGVTGLAQINLPPDDSIDSVRKKLLLDCLYIRSATFGMDLRILLCTFLRMLGVRHGRAPRWFGLNFEVPALELTDGQGEQARQWSDPIDDPSEIKFAPSNSNGHEHHGKPLAVVVAGERANGHMKPPGRSGTRRRRPR